MGVTLERVQNKFACIIGELCSEPVVLSQFAIWLDLRLAEYKAKGAISLDCSGDNPDPVWLNGHRLPQKRPTSRDRHYGTGSPGPQPGEMSWSRISAERNSQSPGYDRTESVGERLSPSAVKTEPLDHGGMGAYPVSLHAHELSESRTPPRKRSAAETISSEHELLSSGSKSRRLSHDPNSTADPSSNQSLMSIISGEVQEHDPETVDLTDSDMSMIMNYEDRQSTSQTSRGENSRPSYTSTPSATAGSEFAARSDDSLNTELDEHTGVAWRSGMSLDASTYPVRLRNPYIRSRVMHQETRPVTTVRDLTRAVGMVERWWWKTHGEQRQLEDMPYSELDSYLAHFFLQLKRPDGKDYGYSFIQNIRALLDRFLRDYGCPLSLSKSVEFVKTRQALTALRKTTKVDSMSETHC